ncbi:MAG: penicillin-binding protein [Myxococcaceae bacterium]|nr:penicillin-binding protein [Myxococcaceae bacterium]
MRDLKHTVSAEAPDKWMRLRVFVMGAVFIVLLVAVVARAFQLQVHQQAKLKGMAQDQYVRQIEIPARRGDIFDRRGVPLAQSVDVDSIWVDPSLLPDEKLAARALARALDLDQPELFARLAKARRFAWVKRQVTPSEVARVTALALPGIGFTKEPRRFYPQRELGAHVIGLVGTDGHGLDGLELAFEAELSGDASTRRGFRDARGRKLLTHGIEDLAGRQGAAVTLTLDRHLQYVAEKALTRAVEEAKAPAGTVVVLDPKSGEILALANYPRFNPNSPAAAQKNALRNRAATDAFEPGSTFKAFVVAAALEEKLVNESTSFDLEKGAWKIGKHVINDDHPHEALDVHRILQVSSNIGAAKIGAALGRERLVDYYAKFGFGERVGLGLPGEGRGVVPFPRAEISLATQSFGQGLTATAIQLAAGYAALANGGVLMKPYLVSKVVDPDGVTLIDNQPTEVRRVVSAANARRVIAMLESVVEKGGTAPRARMDEYRVAGKTGTAQKADPVARGYSDKRIGSFVGVVPAENPRLVVLVVLDEPKTDVYGGIVAAPAFKEIATAAMPYLSVKPSRPPTPEKPGKAPVVAPEPARVAAKASALNPVVAAIEELDAPAGAVRVPNLTGRAGRDAVAQLLAVALEPRLAGSGRVSSQQPAAGSLVERGTRVTLELAGPLPTSPR